MSKSYRKIPCWCNAHPKNPFKTKRYWNKKRRQKFKKFIDEEGMPDMPKHGGVAWPLQKNLYEYRSADFSICKYDSLIYVDNTYNKVLIPYSKDLFSRRTSYKIPKNIPIYVIRCIRISKFK